MLDIQLLLNSFTGFFVIIDPIGAALIFHALTMQDEKAFRLKMAVKSTLLAGALLIVFGNYGEPLLAALGININAMRIAGGLLLFYTAFNMITTPIEYSQGRQAKDVSVYPLCIPLMAGPGGLTLAILQFSKADGSAGFLAVVAAILLIIGLTFLLMVISSQLKRVIGQTGDEILRRFLGVVLAALAIQFVYDGINNLISY